MKKTSLICKLTMAALAVGLTAVSARADYVLGSWQTSNINEGGWFDHGTGLPLSLGGTATYTLASGVVPGFAQSLYVHQNGWGQSLQLNLTDQGEVAAFLTNNQLSFQFSAPIDTATSGWNQMYAFTLIASGTYGWQNLSWSGGTGYTWTFTDVVGNNDNNSSWNGGKPGPNYWYGPAAALRSQTAVLDYTGLIPILQADGITTASDLEILFAPNPSFGTSPGFYLNNVVLLPEPATLTVIGLGLTAGIAFLRRRSS